LADRKDKFDEAQAPDLPVDREQGLALQFDDPGIAELLPLMSGEEPTSLAADVADAVQELVFDLNAAETPATPEAEALEASEAGAMVFDEPSPVTEIEGNPALDFDLSADLEAAELEGTGIDTAHNVARILVAEKMFDLLVVEKSFNDLAENILASLIQASSATAGSILELDYDRREFFFRAVYGSNDPEKIKAFRVPTGKGIVGHVAESRQSLLLNDMDGDDRQLRAISASAGLEIVTCMAFPVLITNRLYGVVEIFNKVGGGHFDKADLQLMEEGARMAGKVLEVRFLMAELIRKVK
jgi:hypothetical protein